MEHVNNQQELPLEWQERDHYDLRVAWLSKERPEGTEELEEKLRELMRERGVEEDAEVPSLEVTGHPGWWLYFNIEMGHHDSLDEALAAAKTVLKRSDLNAGTFNLDVRPGTKAPAQLSKSQRRKLIDQIMNPPAHELPEGIVHEAFLEVGNYALSAWIESLPFREEFSASFASPENPLRSLIGRECVLKTSSYEDADEDLGEDVDEDFDEDFEVDEDADGDDIDEDVDDELEIDEEFDEDLDEFDEDIDDELEIDEDLGEDADNWQETARGVLAIEGNILRVGDWSQEIEPDEPVYGVAFEWAELESEALQASFYIEAVEEEDERAG